MPARASSGNTERLAVLETSMAELCKRFESWEGRMERFLEELKAEQRQLLQSMNAQSNLCGVRGKDLDALKDQVKEHEKRVNELEKLVPAIRAIIWVGAALGLSIIGLIWALITGQAQIIFK